MQPLISDLHSLLNDQPLYRSDETELEEGGDCELALNLEVRTCN
jgi:hypothetical protein